MNTPKHSIIVPAYNTGDTIRRCLDSILAQGYGAWELIVVDDGSQDSTSGIIDEYAQKDERIHAIHVSNGGVAKARNIGIENATGEYVMFVDSDDWIEPDYLEQVEAHMQDIADIYIVNISHDYSNKKRHIYYSDIKGTSGHKVIRGNKLSDEIGYLLMTVNMESCWAKSFRLEFLNKNRIRFHEEMIVFEDYHFVLQCLLNKSDISLIPFIGYHYVTDLIYDTVARRGYRDLYPSIHNLFAILETVDKLLVLRDYSHEIVMQIMTDKISVVLLQSLRASNYAERTKPFRQICNDPVLNRNISDVMKYSGGRKRLQYKFMRLNLFIISYLLYRYI